MDNRIPGRGSKVKVIEALNLIQRADSPLCKARGAAEFWVQMWLRLWKVR